MEEKEVARKKREEMKPLNNARENKKEGTERMRK